jgi:hypothetical protein
MLMLYSNVMNYKNPLSRKDVTVSRSDDSIALNFSPNSLIFSLLNPVGVTLESGSVRNGEKD